MELITWQQGLVIYEPFINEHNSNNKHVHKEEKTGDKECERDTMSTPETDRMHLVVNWSSVSFESERWNYSNGFIEAGIKRVGKEGWSVCLSTTICSLQ